MAYPPKRWHYPIVRPSIGDFEIVSRLWAVSNSLTPNTAGGGSGKQRCPTPVTGTETETV